MKNPENLFQNEWLRRKTIIVAIAKVAAKIH